jgi:hypothetical protein
VDDVVWLGELFDVSVVPERDGDYLCGRDGESVCLADGGHWDDADGAGDGVQFGGLFEPGYLDGQFHADGCGVRLG